MNRFDFWSEWDTRDQLIFKLLFAFLILLILFVVVFDIGGFSYFYEWEMTGYLQEILYPIYSNHSQFAESTINTEISFILQKVSGSYQLLKPWMVFLFAIILYGAVMTIMAILTYLSRFWFVICMGLFVLLVAGTGIGRVGLFGMEGELVIGLVAAPFMLLAYYFHAVNDGVRMLARIGAFFGIWCVLTVSLSLGTSGEDLWTRLAYEAYWPALVITIVFILMIGHEIVYAILILTTQDERDSKSSNAVHFVVLSLIYLLNVILIYLRDIGYIDWDFYYIHLYLLVSISAVLGFWGLKGREVLYRNILPFYPYGGLLYLLVAIVAFSSLTFFIISSNDPAIEVVEDAIVFGHIAFGGMFFLYIIINFISLIVKNLPVYRIAFKEDNFPYATSRLAGIIAVTAFFLASNNAALSHAITGYFNTLGDMFLSTEKPQVAMSYYSRGAIYGNLLAQSNGNHKSNYMLGVLESDPEKAIPKLKGALVRRPTDYAYASLGYAYERDNRFFEALFTYQNGLRKFPESWALNNNLALLYNRTDVIDSVMYYLDNVTGSGLADKVAETNKLAISALNNEPITPDRKKHDWMAHQNNLLAYDLYRGNELVLEDDLFNPSRLNLFTFSYLKNVGLASVIKKDSSFLSIVDQSLEDPYNGDYLEDIMFTKGINLYGNGEVTKAYELMHLYQEQYPSQTARVNTLLGKWSRELNAHMQASKYFELARESAYPRVTTDLAQTYAMIGQNSIGQYILSKEIESVDTTSVQVIERLVGLREAVGLGPVEWEVKYDFAKDQMILDNLLINSEDTSEQANSEFRALGLRNPFFEEGVLASVAYFNKQNKPDIAYEVLLNSITINTFSESLTKVYIDQCLKMGLMNYAEDALMRLYDILSVEEFEKYELLFEENKASAEAALDTW